MPPQDLAQVVEGDAQVCCDLAGRGVSVEQGVVDGAGSVCAGSAPGQPVAVTQLAGGCDDH